MNDETPTFRARGYVGEVAENAHRGTPVNFVGGDELARVYDHDAGINGTFSLSILDDPEGIFEVSQYINKHG